MFVSLQNVENKIFFWYDERLNLDIKLNLYGCCHDPKYQYLIKSSSKEKLRRLLWAKRLISLKLSSIKCLIVINVNLRESAGIYSWGNYYKKILYRHAE